MISLVSWLSFLFVNSFMFTIILLQVLFGKQFMSPVCVYPCVFTSLCIPVFVYQFYVTVCVNQFLCTSFCVKLCVPVYVYCKQKLK